MSNAKIEHFSVAGKAILAEAGRASEGVAETYDFKKINDIVDPWYLESKKEYYERLPDGSYGARNIDEMAVLARHLGMPGNKIGNGNTVIQEWLLSVRNDRKIAGAGEFAGFNPGVMVFQGSKLLCTQRNKFIAPKAGSWEGIRRFITNLISEEQLPYFMGWHADAVRSTYAGEWKRTQMLVLSGGPGCGKSFWQVRVLTGIWGTSADPYDYMSGRSTFNDSLMTGVHLQMSDVGGGKDDEARRQFGAWVKKFVAEPEKTIHQKGKAAFKVPLNQRVSLAINAEDGDICVLPPLDSGMLDKVSIFKCEYAALPKLLGVKDMSEFEKVVADELPAFVHYLLHEHVTPHKLLDSNGQTLHWCDPSIKEVLESHDTSDLLLELFDNAWFSDGKRNPVERTALQMYSELKTSNSDMLNSVVKNAYGLGRGLSRLSGAASGSHTRISSRVLKGRRVWRIEPPTS